MSYIVKYLSYKWDHPTLVFATPGVCETIRARVREHYKKDFLPLSDLADYQNKNLKVDMERSVMDAIEFAYPKLELDENGQPKDNRQQNYIHLIMNFSAEYEALEEKQPDKLKMQDVWIYQACDLIMLISSIENSNLKLEAAIKKALDEGARPDALEEMLEVTGFQLGLDQLTKLLVDKLNGYQMGDTLEMVKVLHARYKETQTPTRKSLFDGAASFFKSMFSSRSSSPSSQRSDSPWSVASASSPSLEGDDEEQKRQSVDDAAASRPKKR